MSLGENTVPENIKCCNQHIPGFISGPFTFKVKENPENFLAYSVIPYGTNPKKITPVLAWVQDESGSVYNPDIFFEKELGKIWKDKDQKSRVFTLYGDKKSMKVVVYRRIAESAGSQKEVPALEEVSRDIAERFNEIPLACFLEDETVLPITCIDQNTIYGKYIRFISDGNLKEAISLYINNKEDINKAYPYLERMNINIENVFENPKSLEWFDENKINLVDDSVSQKCNLKSFEDLCKLFSDLYKKKEDSYKGILPLVSKAFAYIPNY